MTHKTNTESQTKKILNWMLRGHKITALQALRKFQCFRLASRINELKENYKVNREMITLKNKKRIARYSINL